MAMRLTRSSVVVVGIFISLSAFSDAITSDPRCGTLTCKDEEFCCSIPAFNIRVCMPTRPATFAFPYTCEKVKLPGVSHNRPRTTTTKTATTTKPTAASLASTAVSSTTADPAVCGSQRCESGQYCCYNSFFKRTYCHSRIPTTFLDHNTCHQVHLSKPASKTTTNPKCGWQTCAEGQYCCFESFTTVSSCMNSIPSKSTYLCKRVQTFLPTTTTPKTTKVPTSSDASVKVQIADVKSSKCGSETCDDGEYCCSSSMTLDVKSCHPMNPSTFLMPFTCTKVKLGATPSSSSDSVKVQITSGVSCGSSTCATHQYCCDNDWDDSGKSCFDTQPSLLTHSCDNAFPSFVHAVSSFSVAAIVGIVIGSILFIVLLATSVVCAVRRWRRPIGLHHQPLADDVTGVHV